MVLTVILDWSELKTGDSDEMTFFCARDSFLTDFYHRMAYFLIFGGGNSTMNSLNDMDFIMPDLARNLTTAPFSSESH
jgi:hypothetical protein